MSKNAAIRQRGDRIQPKSDAKLVKKNGNRKKTASVTSFRMRFPLFKGVIHEIMCHLGTHPSSANSVIDRCRRVQSASPSARLESRQQHFKLPVSERLAAFAFNLLAEFSNSDVIHKFEFWAGNTIALK